MRHWRALLPYETDAHGAEWLANTKCRLAAAVHAGSLAADTSAAVRDLDSILTAKFPLSAEDRASLARMLYTLATLPRQSMETAQLFCNVAVRLMKSENSLPNDAMTLDWRPLAALLESGLLSRQKDRDMPGRAKSVESAFKLARSARRFFSPQSAAEILDRYLPNVNPHFLPTTIVYLLMAMTLLPVHAAPVVPETWSKEHPEAAAAVAAAANRFFWVPTLFGVWDLVVNVPVYDLLFMDIFGRLAEAQRETPEQVVWTDDQIRTVFAIGMRNFELPVGSGSSGLDTLPIRKRDQASVSGFLRSDAAADLSKRIGKNKFDGFSKFIVYTLFPPQPRDGSANSPTLTHLESLIHAIEGFLHPSNTGKWSSELAQFVRNLTQDFLARSLAEQSPDCETPPHMLLTPEIKSRFVALLRNVAYLGMFGKDLRAVSLAHGTLKDLAWIDPTAVFPGLLARVYPALESLTETHRTISCISALGAVSYPLFNSAHYPEGGQHLCALLHLTLPGLDVNDTRKSIATLLFISRAVVLVPLVDVASSGYTPEVAGDDTDRSRFEAHEATRLSTGDFESWVVKFIDRLITLFENLPHNHGSEQSSQNTVEGALLDLVTYTCDLVFSQLSDSLLDVAIRKMVRICQDTVLASATKTVALLCGSLSRSNPARRLKAFVPICVAGISQELESGAASKLSGKKHAANTNPFSYASMSDATLHWYQAILNACVANAGDAVLEYSDELSDVLDKSISACNARRGYKWAGRLLRNIVASLTTVYPLEARSHSPSAWSNSDFQQTAHMHWGEQTTLESAEIQWHVPSTAGITFAETLLRKYLAVAVAQVELSIAGSQQAWPLPKSLSLLKNCIYAMTGLVQIPRAMSHENHLADLDLHAPRTLLRPPPAGACFTPESHPQQHAFWMHQQTQVMPGLLKQLADYMTGSLSDDVEAAESLISCIQAALVARGGLKRQAFVNAWNIYKGLKSALKLTDKNASAPVNGSSKNHEQRFLIVHRTYLLHLTRVGQAAASRPFTPAVRALIGVLAELGMSGYTLVRKRAQKALSQAYGCYPIARFDVLESATAALDSASYQALSTAAGETGQDAMDLGESVGAGDDSDRIKGALYMLRQGPIQTLTQRHWKYASMLLKALVRAQREDKPTVLELIRRNYVDFLLETTGVPLDEPTLPAAILAEAGVADPAEVNAAASRSAALAALSRAEYTNLIDSLVEFAQDNASHWRFSAMAASLLSMLLSAEAPVPAKLAHFAAANVVNEHPIMRQSCLSLLTQILVVLKERATSSGAYAARALKQPIPGDRLRQAPLFSIADPASDPGWLCDELRRGWLVTPGAQTVYFGMLPANSVAAPFHDTTSAHAHAELERAIAEPEFWAKLALYASQEASRGSETFDNQTAMLVKRLSGLFEERVITLVAPIIESFVSAVEDKSKQRAAAEMTAGLIRGSKHWNAVKQEALWAWAIPLLSRAFTLATTESIAFWVELVSYVCRSRDPRRMRPLVRLLLVDTKLDPAAQSFFPETKKLLLARTLLVCFASHLTDESIKQLDTYLQAFDSPYEQIRDNLGHLINELLQIQWRPAAASVVGLVAGCLINGPNGGIAVPLTRSVVAPADAAMAQLVLVQLPKWRAEPRDPSSSSSRYGSASKTLLAWFADCIVSMRAAGVYPFVDLVLPELFEMLEHWDADLQERAAQIAQTYPLLHHHSALAARVVEQLLGLLDPPATSDANRWHVKVRVLPVLQVLFFRHLHLLHDELVAKVLRTVASLLADRQVEVRQLASVTLSGLVRCSPRAETIAALEADFRKTLSATARQVTSTRGRAQATLSSQPQATDQVGSLVKRHSAVLGLAALVLAFPYQVPAWMPGVLVALSRCATDPAPIRATITKTFADFKRTHQDNWEEDKQVFSEDELEVLADLLISPGYYA
ncbi:Proteasome activator BLM10 [Polyrhizophydium stewartii]|uniref:Proteasome activator BLM10 n=1 Tax=Polyrhizophydium stewartii TaxID=2732419 RepID=A0ABR4N6X5_9FUNG